MKVCVKVFHKDNIYCYLAKILKSFNLIKCIADRNSLTGIKYFIYMIKAWLHMHKYSWKYFCIKCLEIAFQNINQFLQAHILICIRDYLLAFGKRWTEETYWDTLILFFSALKDEKEFRYIMVHGKKQLQSILMLLPFSNIYTLFFQKIQLKHFITNNDVTKSTI